MTQMDIRNQIKNASEVTNKAQRNYDLAKSIPQEDLDTLIYVAVNSPSKQNETHYSLHVYTDQTIIKQIYSHTKKFTMIRDRQDQDKSFKVENDIFIQNDANSVTNSQVYANALFVYVLEQGKARGSQHRAAKEYPNSNAARVYTEQIAYSMGISIGELILAAGLMGYKTGICSALVPSPIRDIIGIEQEPRLLVGVGIPNNQLERNQHSELLNKDVPEKFRTGGLNEHWKFPTFKKFTKVTINGIDS
jgi:nitroreductase